jgi:hypothetical protein
MAMNIITNLGINRASATKTQGMIGILSYLISTTPPLKTAWLLTSTSVAFHPKIR